MAGTINLAEYSYSVTVDGNRVKQDFKNIEKQADTSANGIINSFSKSMNKVQEKFSGLNKLADGLGSLGKGLTVGLTIPIVGLGTAATNLASDFNESLNKVGVAFGDNAKDVEQWSKTTLNKFGIAQGTALDVSSTFGDMATSMGLNTKEASTMAMSMTGLAGDLSSFKNIGVDQAMTALNGVFTGETESLKTLGIVMTQTNLDAFALANGFGKTTKEMTEAEKVNLRYAYVMNATKNAQGDFANTSDGTANSMRIFKESLKQLGATIGQNLLPMITPIVQKFTDIVMKISELDSGTQEMIVKIGLILAAVGPVLLVVSKGIKIFTTLHSAFGAISAIASTAGMSLTAFLAPIALVVVGVVGLALAISTNFCGIRDTIGEVMESCKIIVTSIWEFIKMAWDTNLMGIRTLTETIFNTIKDVFKLALDVISQTFSIFASLFQGDWEGAWNKVKELGQTIFEGIKNIFVNFLTGIKDFFASWGKIFEKDWGDKWNTVKFLLEGVWEAISIVVDTALNFVKDIFNVFSKAFHGDWKGCWEAIKKLFFNLWDGIVDFLLSILATIINTIISWGVDLYKGAKEAFSKLWNGCKEIWGNLVKWFEKVKEDPVGTIKSIGTKMWNAGKEIFSSVWDGMKSIWENICSWVEEKVSWLVDKLSFWKSGKEEMNSGNGNGDYSYGSYNSYAIGNNNLATNGLALLHQGEMVMPRDYNPFNSNKLAEQLAKQLSSFNKKTSSTSNTYNVNANFPNATSTAEIEKALLGLSQKAEQESTRRR